MKKRVYAGIVLVFVALIAVSGTILAAKAAFSISLTPLSGKPGDTIGVSSVTGDFEPLTSVGIGFGAEVVVVNEPVTPNGDHYYLWGKTANRPIKPGSFSWTYRVQSLPLFEFVDNGDGTLSKSWSALVTETSINYTTGLFSRSTDTPGEYVYEDSMVNYTTYELDVTPDDGATTSASGYLIETMTVPPVPNGSYTVTAIDELGNVGTGTFQVVGSDVIPEPITVTAIVLLSSTAVIVSFHWVRKRTLLKV